MTDENGQSLTFNFEIEEEGDNMIFVYQPETWNFRRIDDIQIVSNSSGTFTVRFIQIDPVGTAIEDLSPVKETVDSKVKHPVVLSGYSRESEAVTIEHGEFEGQEFRYATDRVEIRDEPEIIAAGRARNVTKVAFFQYAIACQYRSRKTRKEELVLDAQQGGAWDC